MTDQHHTTVRSVVAHGAGDLRIDTGPVPEPAPSEALVAITHAGICGSDLHYYRSGRVGAFELREPLVVGHEVVGVVADPGDSGYAAGTPVAVHPAFPCGRCPECRDGRQNVCRTARYLGSAASTPHTQGGMRELMPVAAERLRPLPDDLPLDRAVLAEPLAVALHAWGRAGDLTGRTVLVSGAGPIGLLAVRAAVRLGAAEVWASDLLERPLALARELGAARTVDLRTETVPRQGFDVVLEAAGVPVAVTTAIRAVRRGGVVVQAGMVPAGPIQVELSELVTREVQLRGTFRFHAEFDDAIAMLAADPGFAPVVTDAYDLPDVVAAFDRAADPARSSKVVVRLATGGRR